MIVGQSIILTALTLPGATALLRLNRQGTGRRARRAGAADRSTHSHRAPELNLGMNTGHPGGPLGSDRSWDSLFQRSPPSSEAAAAFPILMQGRRPHWSFRGLLDVRSCYGVPARCIAKATHLSRRLGFVTSTAAPRATGWSDPVAGWELHPLRTNTFARRTLIASQFPSPRPCFLPPEFDHSIIAV